MAQKFANGRWVEEGFLDNRINGLVVGRITFAAIGPVDLYLKGDFKSDIAGQVIQFRNSRFEEDEVAGQVIGDMQNPQIGTVNLISFDPHPNLAPHPYVEWFSTRSDHYRFELDPGEAWIVPESERNAIDQESKRIRELPINQVGESATTEDSEWV
ncbi:MAG TPA: hypothetical protein VIU63_06215 [Nitrospira sp.]